jgi:hypothetical protein
MPSRQSLRTQGGALRNAVASPGDAWLLARMLGWSLALPALKFVLPLQRLARLMHSESRLGPDPHRFARIVALAAWVFKSRSKRQRENCLERALVTYRYLGRAGAKPELVVGISKDRDSTFGHVWVTVDGHPVHDTAAYLRRFSSLVSFGSDGNVVSTAQSSQIGGSGEAQARRWRLPAAERRH